MKRRDFLAATALGGAALALPAWFVRRNRVSPGTAPARADLRFESHPGRRIVESGHVCDLDAIAGRVELRAPDGPAVALAAAVPASVSVRADAVHVVEWGANRVATFDLDGRRRGELGGAELCRPGDLAWLEDERVVADTFHQRLAVFSADGRLRRTIGRCGSGEGELCAASSVAVDRDGRCWVADAANARVQVFSAGGRALGSIGGRGTREGRLLSPACVRIDGRGDVHVADPAAGLVHVFDAGGGFRQRHRPADGIPTWLSILPDGTVLVSLSPGRTA